MQMQMQLQKCGAELLQPSMELTQLVTTQAASVRKQYRELVEQKPCFKAWLRAYHSYKNESLSALCGGPTPPVVESPPPLKKPTHRD
jgi:hypothetical protein